MTRSHFSNEAEDVLPDREDNNPTIPASHQKSDSKTPSLKSKEISFKNNIFCLKNALASACQARLRRSCTHRSTWREEKEDYFERVILSAMFPSSLSDSFVHPTSNTVNSCFQILLQRWKSVTKENKGTSEISNDRSKQNVPLYYVLLDKNEYLDRIWEH